MSPLESITCGICTGRQVCGAAAVPELGSLIQISWGVMCLMIGRRFTLKIDSGGLHAAARVHALAQT